MAKSATSVLWRSYREVPINIQAVQEPKNAVVGNGTGIIVVAETTTGKLSMCPALVFPRVERKIF